MALAKNVNDDDDDNVVALPAVDSDDAEDIDPVDWLSESNSAVTQRYVLPNGKAIKIAPLTDAEEYKIQKESRRPDPKDPRRMVREFTIYKRMFIAASINKAYGAKLGDASYVDPEALKHRNVGELTNLMTAIMKLSGMDTEGTPSSTGFFS